MPIRLTKGSLKEESNYAQNEVIEVNACHVDPPRQGLKFRVSRKFRRSKNWKFRWKFRGNIDRKKIYKIDRNFKKYMEILNETF